MQVSLLIKQEKNYEKRFKIKKTVKQYHVTKLKQENQLFKICIFSSFSSSLMFILNFACIFK